MDGLIPLVYKAIRRSSTRQKYECLSSSQSHNLLELSQSETPQKAEGLEAESRDGHRRHRSGGAVTMLDHPFGNTTAASPVTDKKQPQLVRFHSHRV